MDEILRTLPAGSLVLDLGCAEGSFPASATRAKVVRVDRDRPRKADEAAIFVQADAARLPFADRAFEAVISNHSLEHFDDVEGALSEIGRVVDPNGTIYVAVPDASTFSDRLYRWLSRGGGHVNAFCSKSETASLIEKTAGLSLVATRLLYSSLSMLSRRDLPGPIPLRLRLLGGGREWSLFVYTWLSRRLDRRIHTRLSLYGWAFYFGQVKEPVDVTAWTNVCIRCGSGASALFLLHWKMVKKTYFGPRIWKCPQCAAWNPFSDDREDCAYLSRSL